MLVVFLACLCTSLCSSLKHDETLHENVPRYLRVYSKGPEPDDEKYHGKNLMNHLDNVFQGGSIGVEMDMKKPMGKFDRFWGKVRKYFPGLNNFEKRSDKRSRFFPPAGRESDVPKEEEERDLVGNDFIHPRIKPAARLNDRLIEP